MSRRNHIPAYRLHKQSGQAIVTLPDGLGGRHDFTLGEYGAAARARSYETKALMIRRCPGCKRRGHCRPWPH
jgi:hypothetical protein